MFALGQQVQHATDPAKLSGIVIGIVFVPSEAVLVRWPSGISTFERYDSLSAMRRVA